MRSTQALIPTQIWQIKPVASSVNDDDGTAAAVVAAVVVVDGVVVAVVGASVFCWNQYSHNL